MKLVGIPGADFCWTPRRPSSTINYRIPMPPQDPGPLATFTDQELIAEIQKRHTTTVLVTWRLGLKEDRNFSAPPTMAYSGGIVAVIGLLAWAKHFLLKKVEE